MNKMLDLSSSEIDFIRRVLTQAAHLAQTIQSEKAAGFFEKEDLSPVTVADFAVQAFVAYQMNGAFPTDVLVAEEGTEELLKTDQAHLLHKVTEYVARLIPNADSHTVGEWIDRGTDEPTERFWTLDPIDGTKGYRRNGQYAIALALIEEGVVRLGGLACPVMNHDCAPLPLGEGVLVLAKRGSGTWATSLSTPNGTFKPLHVSSCSKPEEARLLRSFEAGHTDEQKLEALASALGITNERCVLMDSQAKYASMAAGHAEFLFRLLSPTRPYYRERIWDQAAGALIIEEAGGKITDLYGHSLDFSCGRTLRNNVGVFASNARLHPIGLEMLQQLGI